VVLVVALFLHLLALYKLFPQWFCVHEMIFYEVSKPIRSLQFKESLHSTTATALNFSQHCKRSLRNLKQIVSGMSKHVQTFQLASPWITFIVHSNWPVSATASEHLVQQCIMECYIAKRNKNINF